jgi:hypothetical protein
MPFGHCLWRLFGLILSQEGCSNGVLKNSQFPLKLLRSYL